MRFHLGILLLLSLALQGLPLSLSGQIPVAGDRGVVPAGLLLRQLDGEKRILMIGAHPDDEDTALLAVFAREWGARTAYLSLTRGEGGQNLIGPELDEGLGIIRTGELEAARRLDGAEQYFTRAFDFGFSKSADETFRHWPREELLEDVVEVIRRFRPHVVVSVFSGTPRDGHGHHQVSGMVATEAFHVAGDPHRFPRLSARGLQPWTPAKLYQRFRGIPGGASLGIPTGKVDPLLGRSHFQVAMESRSQHRSQDMGVPQTPGPRESQVVLTATAPGIEEGPVPGLFAGVDTTLAGLAAGIRGPHGDQIREALRRYRTRVGEATRSLDALDPARAVPPLAAAAEALDAAWEGLAGEPAGATAGLREALDFRRGKVEEAIMAAAGLSLELRAGEERVVPGEAVELELLLWNGGPFPLEVEWLGIHPDDLPSGWRIEPSTPRADDELPAALFGTVPDASAGPGGLLTPGILLRETLRVRTDPDAVPTRLYFLAAPREGSLYSWPEEGRVRGLARDPAPLHARARLRLHLPETEEGTSGSVLLNPRAAVRHVGVDKALGEFETPLLVLPAFSVEVEPGMLVRSSGDRSASQVTVRVRNLAPDRRSGTLALEPPPGWRVEPASHPVELSAGAQRSLRFHLHPPEEAGETGEVRFRAVVRSPEGREYREGVTLIEYPHIVRTPLHRPAELRVPIFPVQVARGLRVGYVMGSGDDGPRALTQMGAEVELLTPADLQAGGLERFHTIVLGVRVYEVVPSMFEANEALLEFARRGGTVVSQYNKYEYPEGGVAPYPVSMARPHDRVTDENAPVTILDPSSPVFTTPNRITQEDFEGWVQERGLYFLSEWDDRFVPLLEMSDPGEEPKQGGLVVAPLGEGLYVYTGLAFFRQFPEGVPGAHRLFANLVSLRASDWHAARAASGGTGGESFR